MKLILMLLVLLVAGCTSSAPPVERDATMPPPPERAAAVPVPAVPAVPASVGQPIFWTMDNQTTAAAQTFETWLYIGTGDKTYAQLTPVTCTVATPTETVCKAALPASKGWTPGLDHQVTLTQYAPATGQESVRSDAITVFLSASVGKPRNVGLDAVVPIVKPPAP